MITYFAKKTALYIFFICWPLYTHPMNSLTPYKKAIQNIMKQYMFEVPVPLNGNDSIELPISKHDEYGAQETHIVERAIKTLNPSWKNPKISTRNLRESQVGILYTMDKEQSQRAALFHYENDNHSIYNYQYILLKEIEKLNATKQLDYARFITIFPCGGPRLLFNKQDEQRCKEANEQLQSIVKIHLLAEKTITTEKPYYIPFTGASPIKIGVTLRHEQLSTWYDILKVLHSFHTNEYPLIEEEWKK